MDTSLKFIVIQDDIQHPNPPERQKIDQSKEEGYTNSGATAGVKLWHDGNTFIVKTGDTKHMELTTEKQARRGISYDGNRSLCFLRT